VTAVGGTAGDRTASVPVSASIDIIPLAHLNSTSCSPLFAPLVPSFWVRSMRIMLTSFNFIFVFFRCLGRCFLPSTAVFFVL
jgi:hypothetical protein